MTPRKEVIGGYSVLVVGEEVIIRVYAICPNHDDAPVYIGSTTQSIKNRIRGHCLHAKDGSDLPVHRWLRKQTTGFQVRVLETFNASSHSRYERERFWVAQFDNLLNLTDGGEGGSGVTWSPERREKMAAAIRSGAYFHCQKCGGQFWRKQREIKLGHNKFCSRKCYQESLRGISKPLPKEIIRRGIIAAAAAKRAKTHCRHGHEYTLENTRYNKNNARVCRQCVRDAKARLRAKVNAR